MNPLLLTWRRLIRHPAPTTLQFVVLTLGMALAAAALSPLWRAVLVALPITDPAHVVSIWEESEARGWTSAPASPANIRDWTDRSRTLAAVAFHVSGRERDDDGSEKFIEGPAGAELARELAASHNLLDVLGVRPAYGRGFNERDGDEGAIPVALISDALAQRQFGDPRRAVGGTLRVDGVTTRVIGVAPAAFWFPSARVSIWTPLHVPAGDFLTRRQARIFRVVARTKPDASVEQTRRDLIRVATELSREYPRTNGNTTVGVSSLGDWIVGPRRAPYSLAAVCGVLVLLAALVNAGFVAAATIRARDHELAIALALGAGRARLSAEVMIDAMVVVVAAAACAWPIATAVLAVARAAFGDAALPMGGLDGRALAAAAFASAAGLAVVAAVSMTRLGQSIGQLLSRAENRRVSRRSRHWANAMQVGAAIALALGALAAARGLSSLVRVRTGIADRDAMAATVTLRGPRFADERQVAAYFREAVTRVRALPGVTSAGATAILPLAGRGWTAPVWIPGIAGVAEVEVRHREITDGYVRAAGLPLIEGREFIEADARGPRAMLVNRAFVQQLCRGASPLGRQMLGAPPEQPSTPSVIVGVVDNERLDVRDATDIPMVYVLHSNVPEETMTIVARGRVASGELRAVLTSVDPASIVLDVAPLDRAVANAWRREAAVATLSALAAAVALVLVGVGVFGSATHDARDRGVELAIRSALGATSGQTSSIVWRQWVRPVLVGSVLGGVAAWVALSVMAARLSLERPAAVDAAAALAIVTLAVALAIAPAAVRARRTDLVRLLRQ